ncbi:MAG: hypothetical protein OEX00_02460 [Gammaproteobacteria bacterium]|nr:hypothetical protein [Gammaproteobacteria bacterium]MDH5694036.1 hypothetical protein [Gammaproteobacteria bacterium]
MKSASYLLTSVVVSASLIVLTACGGGSSSSDNQTGTKTGVLLPGPISGVAYKTETQSGFTNEKGEFSYLTGEHVQFSIGEIELGKTTAQKVITPFDIFDFDPLYAKNFEKFSSDLRDITKPSAAVNWTMLLLSLDADNNPSNGIKIPNTLHTLLDEPFNLWFRTRDAYNNSSSEFNSLMAKTRLAGVWAGAHKAFTPHLAAKWLYDSLGLKPKLYKRTQYSLDVSPIDVDNSNDYSEKYTYDPATRTVQYGYTYGSSPMEYVSYRIYDENQHPAKERDELGYTIETQYTADYLLSSSLTDLNGDGATISKTTYEHDGNGFVSSATVDNNNDGSIDEIVLYEHDAAGFEYKKTSNGEAVIDTIYDEQGKKTEYVWLAYRYKYYYNDQNQLSAKEEYTKVSLIHRITEKYYYTGGKLSKTEYYKGSEAVLTKIVYTEYDGLSTTIKTDERADGSINSIMTFSKDQAGRSLGIEQDYNADGIVDYKSVSGYDDFGNLIYSELFTGRYPMSITELDYDENHALIRERHISYTPTTELKQVSPVQYYYDENSALTKWEKYSSIDGSVIERRTTEVELRELNWWDAYYEDTLFD